MDRLFDSGPEPAGPEPGGGEDAPLAARVRPRDLGELSGQGHLLGPGSPLRVALESGEPHSAVLVGPPGSGKTTLARMIAEAAGGAFEELSAVAAGKPEVREVLERARQRRAAGRGTVLFLDEIHRFSSTQQDALLPAVEEGLVTLIGATTENPGFSLTSALLSRCEVYVLRALEDEEVEGILRRAAAGELDSAVADDAFRAIARRAGGDARVALGALERAARLAGGGRVEVSHAEQALQRGTVRFDRAGDRHYDTASALIKSMRGSDPDAAVYYLAVALEGGEDPRFIARRLVIFASEDVGLADPHALPTATDAFDAAERVGMPECRIVLSHAVIHLALAPKSNAAYRAIGAAATHVREHGAAPPPAHIRDRRSTGTADDQAEGEAYRYPHDEPDALSPQRLLPHELGDVRFYLPTARGAEAAAAERLRAARRRRGERPE